MKNLSLISLNTKNFMVGQFLILTVKAACAKKNLLVSQIKIHFNSAIFFFTICLFFRTRKLKVRAKKTKKKKGNFFLFLRKYSGKHNLAVINNLNKHVRIKVAALFLKTFKRFKKFLFTRRVDLFADFVNLSSLFVQALLSTSAYLVLLKQIFSNILKKQHTQFFLFLSLVFKQIVQFKLIRGLKFIIAGKLKGKPRTNTLKMLEGKISCQTFSNKITFSKIHAFTRYGVFGLKL